MDAEFELHRWDERGQVVRIGIKGKAAVLALAIGAATWLYASGRYEAFEPDRFRAWLQAAGPWGAALFVAVYGGLQPLGVRSIFFLLSAPLVWSPLTAFLLSWVGTVVASVSAFVFARFVAREWVQKSMPPGIRRLDDRLVTRGFRTVLLLRLIFYTAPTLQYALGVSRVAARPFFVGTVLGVVPFTALVTLLGASINEWLARHPISTWPWESFGPLTVVGCVVVLTIAIVAARKWQAQLSFDRQVFSREQRS